MTLRELRAGFIRRITPDGKRMEMDVPRAEAEGVEFLCPKCFAANGGPVGTHLVICWAPEVPQDVTPNPGRWQLQGTSIDDLTLVAGSSSVLLMSGCMAHFFVRNGEIVGS